MLTLPNILIALTAINIWTIFAFWRDKRAAIERLRRTSEADLLFYALIGGSPGALAARHLFRHKTRKEPFSTRLMVIAALQMGAAVGFLLL